MNEIEEGSGVAESAKIVDYEKNIVAIFRKDYFLRDLSVLRDQYPLNPRISTVRLKEDVHISISKLHTKVNKCFPGIRNLDTMN